MGSKKKRQEALLTNTTGAKPVESAFGCAFLKKFGWTEGQGLGAQNDGIVEPLQVKKRTENLGVSISHTFLYTVALSSENIAITTC